MDREEAQAGVSTLKSGYHAALLIITHLLFGSHAVAAVGATAIGASFFCRRREHASHANRMAGHRVLLCCNLVRDTGPPGGEMEAEEERPSRGLVQAAAAAACRDLGTRRSALKTTW